MKWLRWIGRGVRVLWWAWNASGGRCPACRERYPASAMVLTMRWRRDARGWEWCAECFKKYAPAPHRNRLRDFEEDWLT